MAKPSDERAVRVVHMHPDALAIFRMLMARDGRDVASDDTPPPAIAPGAKATR